MQMAVLIAKFVYQSTLTIKEKKFIEKTLIIDF